MTGAQDLTAAIEAAWTTFRRRLADHVAAMTDDDVLVVEYADALDAGRDDDDERGAAPYVQLVAFGGDQVRLEAVSDAYLDAELALSAEQEERLLDLGWDPPSYEPGDDNFHGFAERRDADRIAVVLVQTLREVYAVPHPAFLVAPQLGLPAGSGDGAPEPVHDHPAELATVPRSHEHLQELVDEAMREVFPDLRHDDDGDIPITSGSSVLFIRVLPDRPAVSLYAEIVLEPVDRDRLALELELLNRAHPHWQFCTQHDLVVMRHELLAVPFSGLQLRLLVERFLDGLDRIATELVARVGGHRFAEPAVEVPQIEPFDESDVSMIGLAGLVELLHLGRPRAATVVGLFEHHRVEIIRAIQRVRAGRADLDGHDVDDVLTALRKALRHASDDFQRSVPLPPKPRSVQTSLLSDDEAGEDTLGVDWVS